MKIAAPGKLILTGAYAVLEGAPAIVVAVDRHATADTEETASTPSREVELAFAGEPAPHVNADPLYAGACKLGLGSSAAMLVAALAARRARCGDDLAAPSVRRELFTRARAIHAASQGGGSGADVAASVYGGVLRYALTPTDDGARIANAALPRGLYLAAFFSGTSARTSDLRFAVSVLHRRRRGRYRECMDELHAGAQIAADSIAAGRLDRFLAAAERTRRGLGMLGAAAEVPIVPEAFVRLAVVAARADAVFLPSGAGGGDVGVYLGREAPSLAFAILASDLGFTHVPFSVDLAGVRRVEERRAGHAVSPHALASSAERESGRLRAAIGSE